MAKSVLTSQAEDFPRWYQDVVAKADLAENGPVRGTMVIKPYGYSIWERVQLEMDTRIKAAGAKNAYFPLFIPEDYLKREAQHVEGFSPELAIVTHGGGKELDAPVVVRPTSETIINVYFSKWVQSHRDLPMLINQWANVVRWEMRPRLFLRTTEFLWQEGHTCHATQAEAAAYALHILTNVYREVMEDVMAIPLCLGRKSPDERFAGAINTLTCEGMMRDGKALQMATSHELGQNFAKAFDTKFQTADGAGLEYVWQTSWGSSTRLIGALIMAHGDDAGLRIPPRLAPVQVVVCAVRDDAAVVAEVERIGAVLAAAGVRIELDTRVDISFGRRAVDWELKGIPVRLELGPRDLESGVITMVRRDSGEKSSASIGSIVVEVQHALVAAQQALFDEAAERLRTNSVDVDTLDDAVQAAQTGFARIEWAKVAGEGIATLKKSAVTVRCLQRPDGSIPTDGDESGLQAWVAKAY